MRVCVAYDCLYPWTVGGAERWYRELALELARAGHQVTYLTRRQWPEDDPPQLPGVRVVAVSREEPLYDEEGRRRIGEALRYGWGVFAWLARHRRAYDAVHLCAFPYFSVLAVRAALLGRREVDVGVDWFEVWSREYWFDYLGGVKGALGWLVQRVCALATPDAYVFSRLHGRRLSEEGLRSEPHILAGLYAGETVMRDDAGHEREPLVVFAGRHIPEKQVTLIPPAIAAARRRLPGLRAVVLGDGPERPKLLEAIEREGLRDVIDAPGFVSAEEVEATLSRAACLLLPSVREGYGMVVVEAASHATPSVVVPAPDNAAVELVDDGVNGILAAGRAPEQIGEAIVRALEGGVALRATTADWFTRNAPRLTVSASARTILDRYRRGA